MQFRQDRPQDEKDMAFETSGALDEREAVGTKMFLQCSYIAPVSLERPRLAELKDAISAAWDVINNTAFDRAI